MRDVAHQKLIGIQEHHALVFVKAKKVKLGETRRYPILVQVGVVRATLLSALTRIGLDDGDLDDAVEKVAQ